MVLFIQYCSIIKYLLNKIVKYLYFIKINLAKNYKNCIYLSLNERNLYTISGVPINIQGLGYSGATVIWRRYSRTPVIIQWKCLITTPISGRKRTESSPIVLSKNSTLTNRQVSVMKSTQTYFSHYFNRLRTIPASWSNC